MIAITKKKLVSLIRTIDGAEVFSDEAIDDLADGILQSKDNPVTSIEDAFKYIGNSFNKEGAETIISRLKKISAKNDAFTIEVRVDITGLKFGDDFFIQSIVGGVAAGEATISEDKIITETSSAIN